MTRRSKTKGSYALVSLGCPKNLVDSECIAAALDQRGWRLVADARRADLAVINTCGFIAAAREESYAVIREMLQLKRQGRLRGVIVAGCLAQREGAALCQACPGVDQLLGVFARDEVPDAAERIMGGQPSAVCLAPPPGDGPPCDDLRRRLTPPHVAYLRIAEGCNRLCSFCAIPQIRGPYRSKPPEQVEAEARRLAAEGVRELVLVAQDTTFYGFDLEGGTRLPELLRRLDEIDGIHWIRLMYLYPMHIGEELLDVLASARRVLPYLDLPLQHISDEVLRRMRRRVGQDETERLLDRLRERIEGLVLRTTLMVGFPGETEAQFEELVEFVGRRRFERLGVFAYSDEPGTAASELDGHLAGEVIERRRERLMALQQEIAFEHNARQVGSRRSVIIDRDIPGQADAHIGRTQGDAPEVDGVVYVTGKNLSSGRVIPCEIVAAKGYDLVGVAVE